MIIPKTLKIGAHIVKVEEMEFADDVMMSGQCSYVDAKIKINKKLQQTQKEATVIHEAMHFMNVTLNHELLDSLAEQMYQFLKDNNLLK